MKNFNLYTSANNTVNNSKSVNSVESFISKKVSNIANISPFILLLVPVFIVMLITFSIQVPTENITEVKTESKAPRSIANITTNLIK